MRHAFVRGKSHEDWENITTPKDVGLCISYPVDGLRNDERYVH